VHAKITDSTDSTDRSEGSLRRKPTCCLRCGYAMTWDAQRRQFGRLLNRGLTAEEVKALMPRCQKCMTVTLASSEPVKSWPR
jgi:hypothetical protein